MTVRRSPRTPVRRSASVRNCIPGTQCNCPRDYSLCLTIRTMASVELSTDLFDWDNSGIVSLASVEASELAGANLPGRILDINEPSAGFKLTSHKTGKSVLFRLVSEDRDADGDVRFWEFKPLSDRSPMVPAMTVIVYND